jgi:two-component system cell cycle sensor histidine kinase/response regulator CckA
MDLPSLLGGQRVLVVEDDADLRDLLSDLLRTDGFHVAVASDGSEGLRSLRQGPPPDLILLDLIMPVKDGWEFRIEQKLDPAIAMIPVMAMSADATPKAVAIDADVYIRKPFQYEALRSEVRRVLETKRLRYMDRMASLGTLAAGMAHEINNPLTYVIANLQLVERALTRMPDSPRKSAQATLAAQNAQPPALDSSSPSILSARLCDALEGAERIRNIVADVKTFSHAADDHRTLLDVRGVIDSAVRVVFAQIRHKAQMTKEYAHVPLVLANAGQLGQVIVNLLLNAADAMGEGGPEHNVIRIGVRTSSSGQVLIEVSDSGEGIRAEVQSRVFEPFFTTKPVGVGTGLGLSICHGIVQSLGGTISVESEVGRGATFRITLPSSGAAPLSTRPPPLYGARPAARGRVLIVDDEPQVAEVVRLILQSDHDASTAAGAAEAFDILTAEPAAVAFDLILCDLHMSGMSGMDLYDKLLTTRPEAAERMVFMTGGTFTSRSRDFVAKVKNTCVDKPVDATELCALVASRVQKRS